MVKRQKKIRDQVLMFDKKFFKTKKQVREWLVKKGYKKNCVIKKEKCYEAKQRDKYRFIKKTLLCERLCKGVKITKGKLR